MNSVTECTQLGVKRGTGGVAREVVSLSRASSTFWPRLVGAVEGASHSC